MWIKVLFFSKTQYKEEVQKSVFNSKQCKGQETIRVIRINSKLHECFDNVTTMCLLSCYINVTVVYELNLGHKILFILMELILRLQHSHYTWAIWLKFATELLSSHNFSNSSHPQIIIVPVRTEVRVRVQVCSFKFTFRMSERKSVN